MNLAEKTRIASVIWRHMFNRPFHDVGTTKNTYRDGNPASSNQREKAEGIYNALVELGYIKE
jgi:hypothetical protein